METKRFKRQTKNGTANAPDVELDFGAAKAKVASIFEPGEYHLRVQGAKVIERNGNILIALDLVEVDSGTRVDGRPLWVDGPRSDAGNLTAENQHLIAQLLELAKLPTSGNVGELIPRLTDLKFYAQLVLAVDNRNGRSYNAIAGIYMDDAS